MRVIIGADMKQEHPSLDNSHRHTPYSELLKIIVSTEEFLREKFWFFALSMIAWAGFTVAGVILFVDLIKTIQPPLARVLRSVSVVSFMISSMISLSSAYKTAKIINEVIPDLAVLRQKLKELRSQRAS